jgi:hypothetical protein
MQSHYFSHRFLKQEEAGWTWHEVDAEVAREKASQCLRNIVAERKVRCGGVALETSDSVGMNPSVVGPPASVQAVPRRSSGKVGSADTSPPSKSNVTVFLT